jgi:hypothetical protein
MGTEIATIADREMASLMPLLMKCESEASLSDEQFAPIARFAAAPPPALPTATEEDVRKLIGTMAGTLKAARTSTDEGRLKLAVYKRMLGHLPLAALQHATHRALATLEWMPTPAEILKLAEGYCGPERLAYSRAQRLARDRRQRLFDERCKAIRSRAIPADELHTLTEQEIRHGLAHRALLRELDGTVILWTLEDEKRIITERMAQLSLEGPHVSPMDERDKRAEDAPDRVKSSGSVGDLAAGLMAGMEVDDGKA